MIVFMRVLLLGGSWFLGRTLAVYALTKGWRVAAFSRGRSGSPPPGVEHVRGDRGSVEDLARLADFGPWDAVIDTSAYEPADITRVVKVLGPASGRYVLISTVSAYRDWPARPVDEDSRLWPSRLDATESDADVAALPVPFQYGVLKAGCELAAQASPAGSLILRPGVILGPGEYVGRGLKLLTRAQRGGRWLVPGPPEQPIQPVDVRDVSRFALHSIESGISGEFNLTAPRGFATYGDLISACVAVTGGRAEPVWVDPNWLEEQGVQQWTEVPLWRTPPGTWSVDSARAQANGFTCRPLSETLTDFWTTLQGEPLVEHPRQHEHGMGIDREAELLAAWDREAALRGR
jgi:nucleoside-diphosphate-sugar epimerase